jgi:hypothetical protein
MAKVISLESRRKGSKPLNPPVSGSAVILIFTGVRFERLEAKKRVRASKKQATRRNKVAV